jgi:hypothetical protein
VWQQQRSGWVCAALKWRKTLSKTNDNSKFDQAKLENRVLADCELDAVMGGWFAGWGSGTSGSGGGLVLGGLSGEAQDARHRSLILVV